MRIRRILPGDELAVLRAGYLFDHGTPDLAAVRAYVADTRNVLMFAFDGSEALGFLRGTELLQLSSRRKQMFIYEIGVDEDFRRHGIGRALVMALLKDCRDRGFEEAFVFTDPSNEAAVALYRSAGAITETESDRMYVFSLHSGIGSPG